MKKAELIERIKSGGMKNAIAAHRIANSLEITRLADDLEITVELIDEWASASTRPRSAMSLSEVDLMPIRKIIETERTAPQ
jgi:hypothetical protein